MALIWNGWPRLEPDHDPAAGAGDAAVAGAIVMAEGDLPEIRRGRLASLRPWCFDRGHGPGGFAGPVLPANASSGVIVSRLILSAAAFGEPPDGPPGTAPGDTPGKPVRLEDPGDVQRQQTVSASTSTVMSLSLVWPHIPDNDAFRRVINTRPHSPWSGDVVTLTAVCIARASRGRQFIGRQSTAEMLSAPPAVGQLHQFVAGLLHIGRLFTRPLISSTGAMSPRPSEQQRTLSPS